MDVITETIVCPSCQGAGIGHYEGGIFGSSKDTTCPECKGKKEVTVKIRYENIGNGILYFIHNDESNFKTQLSVYLKHNPKIRIVSTSGDFDNGGYGAYIKGHVVIIESRT